MIDWDSLKDKVYYKDGSLRDIIVENIELSDWNKIVRYINNNYFVSFGKFSDSRNTYNSIDLNLIYCWINNINDSESERIDYKANIELGKEIVLQLYFNELNCLLFDFSPKCINSLENHKVLMKYIQDVSNLLSKGVHIRPEMEDKNLLSIYPI
jgi:hypothetical protein